MTKIEHVIIIVIDDVKAEQFFSLIKNSELPNMGSYYNNSHYSDKCVTTFPSTTLPSHVSIFTGRYQDYYKIPCIKWFDKKNEKIHDYASGLAGLKLIQEDMIAANAQTIYEKIDGESLVIFNGVIKGATHTRFNIIQSVSSNFKRYLLENPIPTIVTCWYFESDAKLHHFGSQSKQYLRQLKKIDKDIGKIINELIERELFDKTLVIITSDHGNYSAEQVLNIEDYMLKKNLIFIEDYYVDFGAVGSFYFKGKDWKQPLTVENLKNYNETNLNLLEYLLALPGVQYIAYRDMELVMIQGKKGSGKIKWKGELTKYEFEGGDPLGYELNKHANELIDGKFHSIDEWLKNTIDTNNIIVVDQLARIFQLENSPDIIAVTDGKTVYHHLHSHDLPTPETMKVPLMIVNPDLEKKDLGLIKITDIHDLVLNYLNSH